MILIALNVSKTTSIKKEKNFWKLDFTIFLTGIQAVSDTLRTDGGCQIWTKLGQGGQYITPIYPDLKKNLLGTRGGFLGPMKFLCSEN